MKHTVEIVGVGLVIMVLIAMTISSCRLSAHALPITEFPMDLGENITIPDMTSEKGSGWYGPQEDNEVEPGCLTAQKWDLEAYFLSDTILAIIGGVNFRDGVYYSGHNYLFGDIFLDIDGDAKVGPYAVGAGGTYGYDYALDLEWSPSGTTYDVYSLDPGNPVTTSPATEPINQSSNPFLYTGGGTLVGTHSFSYFEGLTDTDVGGLQGGDHYGILLDLADILDVSSGFVVHATLECGNDALIGAHGGLLPVPEPCALVLLGIGLLGVGWFVKKRKTTGGPDNV